MTLASQHESTPRQVLHKRALIAREARVIEVPIGDTPAELEPNQHGR